MSEIPKVIEQINARLKNEMSHEAEMKYITEIGFFIAFRKKVRMPK